MGRCLHVLHLRVPARVRLRQLCRTQAAAAQRRLSSRRESGHAGKERFTLNDTRLEFSETNG